MWAGSARDVADWELPLRYRILARIPLSPGIPKRDAVTCLSCPPSQSTDPQGWLVGPVSSPSSHPGNLQGAPFPWPVLQHPPGKTVRKVPRGWLTGSQPLCARREPPAVTAEGFTHSPPWVKGPFCPFPVPWGQQSLLSQPSSWDKLGSIAEVSACVYKSQRSTGWLTSSQFSASRPVTR